MNHNGAIPYTYWTLSGSKAERTNGGVIDESRLTLYVNGQQLASIMCSPLDQEALALGFLYNEGIIDSLADIHTLQRNVAGTGVDVFLAQSDFEMPTRTVLTTGCGGGISFQAIAARHAAVESTFTLPAGQLYGLMRQMQGAAQLYNEVRGVHTAGLASSEELLLAAEDVGRHNTIDKITGKALQNGIDTRDRVLLTSGRISSEMLGKARRMGIPLVASRTAPTSLTVHLAGAWNICVVGYLRRDRLRVYTCPERLGLPPLD